MQVFVEYTLLSLVGCIGLHYSLNIICTSHTTDNAASEDLVAVLRDAWGV